MKKIKVPGFLKNPHLWLIILTVVILVLKLAIITVPWPELPPSDCMNPPLKTECALIFDEAHYIPAVRKIMMGQAANNEHPPLSKALMMLGIILFGDNPIGWRFFITLSGAASVYILGRLAMKLTGSWKIGLLAAALFAFDISSFNLSSIAMLDAPALAFSLLAALLFLQERYVFSALSMGLALLCKTSSLFILLALLIYKLLEQAYKQDSLAEAFRRWLSVTEKLVFISLALLLIGLAAYDYSVGAYATPFEHLDYILNYHSSLTFKEGDNVYMPLSWSNPIKPYPRMPYFVVTVTVDGKEYHPVAYYGMQTPLWWMTWLAIAMVSYMAYDSLRKRRFPNVEAFALTWIALTYFIYFPLAYIVHRWVYPFYFYSTLPMIAVSLPYILEGDRFSELMTYILLAVQIVWFIVWFPVKPQWLIDFLLMIGAPA